MRADPFWAYSISSELRGRKLTVGFRHGQSAYEPDPMDLLGYAERVLERFSRNRDRLEDCRSSREAAPSAEPGLGHVGLAHHGGRPFVRAVCGGNFLAVQELGDVG